MRSFLSRKVEIGTREKGMRRIHDDSLGRYDDAPITAYMHPCMHDDLVQVM